MFATKRFLPFFITQCLGAINDNLYKNVLLILVTYSQVEITYCSSELFVNIAAGMFILPFFLFSSHAGQVADNSDKARLIRRLKQTELIIMLLAGVAILAKSATTMLILLFLTGTQSAYFGPVKYALLPQALKQNELVKGNAWVEVGTFLSILIGTLSAGIITAASYGDKIAAFSIFILALLGYISSNFIPAAPNHKTNPQKSTQRPLLGFFETLKLAKNDSNICFAILAISWFWFIGASYLTQFPNFTMQYLSGDSTVVSLLLALFSVGIAVGSWLYTKLSLNQIELGLIPLALIGVSLFSADLLHAIPAPHTDSQQYFSVQLFIAKTEHLRVMFDILFIGLSGGIFIVPLYTYIQSKAPKHKCAQMIAANNIINAFFMVAAALTSILVLSVFDRNIADLFGLIATLNVFIALIIYKKTSKFTLRFISAFLIRIMYRVKIEGQKNIPTTGPALLVSNHVTYLDALILMGASHRPIRFIMDKSISEIPLLKWVFHQAGIIPICSPRQCQTTYNQAFITINEALSNNEMVCIFPEGRLTNDGQLGEFRSGVDKIIKENSVPTVAIALSGMWGSFFSHEGGHALTTRPRRFWSKIGINIGSVAYQEDSITLRQKVQTLIS